MEEVFAILLVLGIFLAIVTVVGHGIWVLLAYIFGSTNRSDKSLQGNHPEQSPRERIDGKTALARLRRQLDSFVFWNAGDEEIRERLSAAIWAEEQALAARPARTMPSGAAAEVQLAPVKSAPAGDAPAESIPVQGGVENALAADSGPGTAQLAEEERVAEPVPLHERARVYAESRAAAASVASATVAEPSKPAEPAVPVSRLFAAFMEENNIRWGELVGGLLIVGCSVALVISLWSQIAGRHLLQFVLFNGVTASLFGIGVYTERRWKIHTTSRGLLVIATLLVPLNFLALAAFTQATPPTDLLPIVGEVISLVVFALLVWMAMRIVVLGEAMLLAIGVMVPCLMQLLVRRFAGASMPTSVLYSLALPPVLVYLGSTALAIRKRWVSASTALSEVEAHRVLLVLGVASAAAIMPLALLLYFAPPARATLHWMSPLVTLCGLPAVLVGLLFWRRMGPTPSSEPSPNPLLKGKGISEGNVGLQTGGIAVGALGAMLMCAGVVLAWPDSATLLPTAAATAVAMLCVAIGFGIPAAHVPAAVASAVAALVAFYVLRGDVSWTTSGSTPLRNALLSATTGYALMPVAAVFAAIAWWLRGIRRNEASFMYGLVTTATTAASLALAVWFGFGRTGDPHNITWLLAIYAVGALAAGVVLGRVDAARGGAAILFVAAVQAVVFRYRAALQLEQPWVVALLVHATLITALCGALGAVVAGKIRVSSAIWAAQFGDVLRSLLWSALVTSTAAAIGIVATTHSAYVGVTTVHLAWLTAVWVLLALLNGSPAFFTASQIAAVLTILFGVAAAVATREWYAAAPRPWLDPWFIEVAGIAIAGYCLLFSTVRSLVAKAAARHETLVLESTAPTWIVAAQRLINTPWPAVDHIAEVALVALVAVVAIYAVVPGVALELSLREVASERVVPSAASFEIPGMPHAHAAGQLGWALVGAVAVALAMRLRYRGGRLRVAGLAIVAMAVCPLVASRWESDVAVASALRWTSACFLVFASVPLWVLQGQFGASEARADSDESWDAWAAWIVEPGPIARVIRDMLVAFALLVYMALGAFVVYSALGRADVPMSVQGAWPWALVWGLLAGVAALFLPYAAGDIRRARMARLDRPAERDESSWTLHARDVLLLLAAAPAVILVTFAIAAVLDKHPIVGPEASSWFRQIGWDVSYGVPLGVIALAFIGHAIRDRSSRFAFAAGLLFNAIATMVVLLRMARGGGTLDATAWIVVGQVNAIVAGGVALIWAGAVAWDRGRTVAVKPQLNGGQTWPLLLVTQVAFTVALCAAFLTPAVVRLAIEWSPLASLPNWVASAGSPLGWCGIGLATVVTAWLNRGRAANQLPIAIFVAALISMIALTILRLGWGDVHAYHALLTGCCAAAWLLPLATWSASALTAGSIGDERTNAWSTLPVRAFDVAAVWLAMWEYSTAASWWVIGALVAIAARNVVVAWREGRRGSIWIAAVLVVIAASSWWLDFFNRAAIVPGAAPPAFGPPRAGDVVAFFWINVLAVASMALISVVVELRRRDEPLDACRTRRGIAFHRFATWAIVATLMLTTVAGLTADLWDESFAVNWPLAWAAWAAAAVTAVACLGDPAVRWSVACLYCVGLIAVGLYLDELNLRSPMFHWALANALAAYSLGTSALWAARGEVRRVLRRWGVPLGDLSQSSPATVESASRRDSATLRGDGHGWLVFANLLIGVFVLVLVVFVELTVGDFTQRMVAAYAVGAQAFAIGLLARGGVRTPLQYLSLVWGALFAVAFGWAFLRPDFVEPWLHRLVVTVAALAVVVVLYGFGLVKLLRRENEWTRAASQLMPPLSVITVGLVLVVLAAEVVAFVQHGQVQITAAARIVIGAALLGLILASLAAALLPGRDPLGLSERGRTLYVYAAEALAALLFLHIRVTMPWLFHGWFLRFWPLVVMAIAFIGVGMGEVFGRRRQRVLAEPLGNTGVLLPLLPVIGFWFVDSHVHYSLLLLSIGALYAATSVLRRSFLYGVLAAVAANGSLWFLLHDEDGLSFLDHPQLWLIPPALSALIAGYINRERLTAQQSAALRYASAIVIYVSSTADIFINGVANAPWLPAVLAALSIVGVLSGIWLRVRAFLYLGTSFLIVAIMTIIWHAAIHQQRTYILFVAGIIAGALLLALFGLFEKRRDDVLRVVEELKNWHA